MTERVVVRAGWKAGQAGETSTVQLRTASGAPLRVALYANTDWYLYNFRAPLIRQLVSHGCEVVLICPPGKYSERFSEFGVDWIPLALSRTSYNPVTEIRCARQLAKILDERSIDVVHSFTLRCVLHSALAVRSHPGIQAVHAITGLGKTFSGSTLRDKAVKAAMSHIVFPRLFRAGDPIVVQNSSDASHFKALETRRPGAVKLIPGSGVDCDKFRSGDRGFEAVPVRVLLAARLIRQKGILEYVDMARDIRDSGEPIECLLAGEPDEGNSDSVTVDEVEGWHREGLVTWLGHVDDMAALYRDVDIVVLPSYYGEGLPKSLIEAGASGVPIVTTDHPGCRDAVDDGVTGLLVPPRCSKALRDAVLRLARDAEMRAQFSQASRSKAFADFDVTIVNSRTLSLYDEAISSSSH